MKLDDVHEALCGTSDAARSAMVQTLAEWRGQESVGNGLLQIGEDYDRLFGLISAVETLAKLTSTSAKKSVVSRGKPPDHRLRDAIAGLAWIYEQVTGKRAARTVSVDSKSQRGGRETGPFNAFVGVALEPLWPNAGHAVTSTRDALKWRKMYSGLPVFYAIGHEVFRAS
jgi:hypothetical protein